MFAEKFLLLTSKYPQNADALARIASYFEDMERRQGERLFALKLEPERLFDISGAGSLSRLSSVIAQLITEKILKRQLIVRVGHGSGVSYSSIDEIPNFIRDPDLDIEVEVTPDKIKTIYVPVK